MKIMNRSNKIIALYQALGLILYVSLFAFSVSKLQQWAWLQALPPAPALNITIFLLVFIISAVVCSSIMFAYPAMLFFGNRKDEAIKIVLWSLAWIILFLIIFVSSIFAFVYH